MDLVIGLILFALLGLAVGYVVPGWPAYLTLIVPVVFMVLTALTKGYWNLLALVLSVVVIIAGILIGRLIDARLQKRREEEPA